MGIVNFCENEWSIADSDKPGANPMDVIDNIKQIQGVKSVHDKVIVIVHGGHEYYNLHQVADYWEQVIIMNDHQKERFADKIIKTLYNTVNGKNIAFLGWAFKKDTNDTRESAAIYVADHLLEEEAFITVYDPKVSAEQIYADLDYLGTRSPEENRRLVKVVTDPYVACQEAHAVAVLTEWDEFKTYNWQKIYDSMYKPAFVFDGRNILNHQELRNKQFEVYMVGKGLN